MVGIIACGGMVLITTPLLIALVAGEVAIEKSFLVSNSGHRKSIFSSFLLQGSGGVWRGKSLPASCLG